MFRTATSLLLTALALVMLLAPEVAANESKALFFLHHSTGRNLINKHHGSVPIQINKHGIFNRRRPPRHHRGPCTFRLCGPGIQIGPGEASLFPACGNVHEAVAIGVGKFDAVGASGCAVNNATFPRRFGPRSHTGADYQQKRNYSTRMAGQYA